MCKKVLKTKENETTFRKAQDIIREFEVLHLINHPCICKSIAINTQEPISGNGNGDDAEYTTISIFLEFLEYSLKDFFEKKNVK